MFIIIGGSIAALLALITFYFITQRIYLEPMRILRDAADQVIIPSQVTLFSDDEAMQDDIERPSISYDDPWEAAMHITSQIKTGDEYERLGQAFNQMLSRMKLSQSTLQKNNQALDAKLTEMAEKNVELYESNQLRSEFLANVSHELRTPLNAIIGFAEILKDQTDPTEQKKMLYVSNVLASGKNLLTTVNDLLDLAKLEVGKFQMHWELCSIGDLAEVLINFSRPLAEKKELTVTSKVPKDMATVNTDTGKLQQILFNLLTNAIKFTSNNGTIDIKAQLIDDNKWFSVQISDSGCGIAQEDHLKIFEKFRQLDGSVTREQSGTGLGLAIVKELTERMGGIITVESALKEGAIFTIKLPSGEENMPKFFVPKPSKL
jgi:signal transduction histidine kinase